MFLTLSTSAIIAQIGKSYSFDINQDSLSDTKLEMASNLQNAEEIFLKITYAGLVKNTVIAYYYISHSENFVII